MFQEFFCTRIITHAPPCNVMWVGWEVVDWIYLAQDRVQ